MSPDVDTLALQLERYREELLQLARGLLRRWPSIDPADVVQTTFEQSIQRPPAAIDNLERWLQGVLRHRVIDAIRKQLRQACEQLPADKSGSATSPSQAAVGKERCQAVRDALPQLPQLEREVIEFSYFFDWTQEEIGEHLGLSRGAVAGRHARGIRRLREFLEKRAE